MKLHSVKIGGSLARNARLIWCSHLSRLASLVLWWLRRVYGGSCKTCPFRMFPTVEIGGCLARKACFGAPTCLVSSRWFSCGVAVSMGAAGKLLLFECVQAGCHVVLRGRRGTLWHSNLFDNVSKVSRLEEVSHEMLVLMLPRVLSRVSGFPLVSPCLWGKLQDLSFSKVSKQVVISFCVAVAALCDIPTCLITCRQFFRVAGATMHSTLCALHFTLHTLQSTLHTPPYSTLYTLHTLQSTLLTLHSTLHHTLHFPVHTLHFTLHTPHPTIYTLDSSLHTTLHTLHFALHTFHFALRTLHSTLYTPHSTLYTPHSSLHAFHFALHIPQFTLQTPHSTLYTPHFTLCTLQFALYTPHCTLHTPHFTLPSPHFTLRTPHFTLHTLHFTL